MISEASLSPGDAVILLQQREQRETNCHRQEVGLLNAHPSFGPLLGEKGICFIPDYLFVVQSLRRQTCAFNSLIINVPGKEMKPQVHWKHPALGVGVTPLGSEGLCTQSEGDLGAQGINPLFVGPELTTVF